MPDLKAKNNELTFLQNRKVNFKKHTFDLDTLNKIKSVSCFKVEDILNEGLKIISSGTGDYTGGDLNQTSFEKHKSVKPEAHLSLANG